MRVRVGTAGYVYPAWKGGFYPPALRPDNWLGFYAERFPLVEINSSFYRPPTAQQVSRMLRLTPDGFAFVFKLPRSATHDGRADELAAFRDGVAPGRDAGRLPAILAQFPEAFRRSAAGAAWLLRLRDAVAPTPLAVEFRHVSWDDAPTLTRLAADGVSVAGVGVPDLPQLFPPGPRPGCGPLFYARLHSERAENWYAGGELRYSYDYPEAALLRWRDGLRTAARLGTAEALVLFNNCVGVQATENARRLMEMLAGEAGLTLVPPPPARGGSLFAAWE